MAFDPARRRVVMARSRKLGHCVCNPKQGCPCDTLRDHNVCPCAGERMPSRKTAPALTRLVKKAGCASKIGQADLANILGRLPVTKDPRVLLGAAAGDDAGVYQLDETHALVQTVDVFTPCVDDAYLFGQIAAANSVSDIYAMGGTPITALSIIGFPIEEIDPIVMESILRGGIDKLAEASCSVIGGHSINDEEIKFGFAVTGLIDPKSVFARDAAQPGDVLVLTKPIGSGVVSFAAQLGVVDAVALKEVGASMASLNKDAALLMGSFGAHACTDITGFGLAGHLVAMVRGSGVVAEIDLDQLPVFAAAAGCLENEIFSGGVDRNQAYASAWITAEDSAVLPILYDPQTSGGLLVALPADRAEGYMNALHARGHTATAIIGRIRESISPDQAGVVVHGTRLANLIGTNVSIKMTVKRDEPVESLSCCCDDATLTCCDTETTTNCCSEHSLEGESTMAALDAFKEFMKEANAPGLIDARTKKLMAITLSIAVRCEPCLKIHMKTGLQMGITQEEIDEAASLAIAFGGCSAMMFYKEICAALQKSS